MMLRAFRDETSPAAQANTAKPMCALPEVRQTTSASADQHGSEIRPLCPSTIRTVMVDCIGSRARRSTGVVQCFSALRNS